MKVKLKSEGSEVPLVEIKTGTVKVDFADSWIKVLKIGEAFLYVYYDDQGYIHVSVLKNPELVQP